jgi:small subunit ribosomal protein S18
MARPRTTRTKREDRDRRPKKKISILDQERIDWVDYKDVNLLRRFMSERAKIRARRVTGNDAQQQRAIAQAIRVAREMALLPYSVRQVTHRNKGRGRGDRDDRGTLAMPSITSTPPPPPSGSSDLDGGFDEDVAVDVVVTEMVDLEMVDLETADLETASESAETAAETPPEEAS